MSRWQQIPFPGPRHPRTGCAGCPAVIRIYIGSVFLLYTLLVSGWDGFHILLMALTATVLTGACVLAASGVSMAVCLLVITVPRH